MLIYVSGAYGPKTNGLSPEQIDDLLRSEDASATIDENIEKARRVGIQLWELGHAPLVPHLNTAHMEKDCKIGHADYLRGDFQMIARCDGIVMLEGWEDSKGATMEHEYAKSLGMFIWYQGKDKLPELHTTEVRSPEQCRTFAEITGQMYRTHLSKNSDYSPMNILMTGEVGLVTRLWDKISRLLSLTGFRAKIEQGTFDAPRVPKNEAIDDTYMDLSVYGVIGLLLRRGKWGR